MSGQQVTIDALVPGSPRVWLGEHDLTASAVLSSVSVELRGGDRLPQVTMTTDRPAWFDGLCDVTIRHSDQRELDAWMNGVADVVEPLGYDREAACGPADLLPGLQALVEQRDRVDEILGLILDTCGVTVWPDGVMGVVDPAEVMGRIVNLTPEQVAEVARICEAKP